MIDLKIFVLTIVKVFKQDNVGLGDYNDDEVDDLGWNKHLK